MRHLLALSFLALPLLAGCSAPRGPVTPTAEAPVASGWKYEVVVAGLEHPWAVAWLPDGGLLITERPGRLRVVRGGRLEPEPVAGVPAVFAQGQGGLMDVALHPRFAENRWVYLTYSAGTGEANRTTLARGTFDGRTLADVRVLWQVAQPKDRSQHFGSRLLWLPDGTLLLSVGDGGNPPVKLGDAHIRDQAQNLGSHFGKVLRLRDDGTPAPGNPLAARPGALPEVWTFGHRNIQGLAFDPASGRVWANEHGARGGDELNLLAAGSNYGWPLVTYSTEYWGPKISDATSAPGMVDPVVVWTPVTAPSGLAFYTGDRFPAWKGDLFSGGLVSRNVRRIDLDGGRVVGQEALPIGQRVRDVRQGPDGFLYVLTDGARNGRLLRLVPGT